MTNVKRVIIMRGVSGSGKSTYAKKQFPNSTIVSADLYFERNGTYTFDRTKLPYAHQWCWKQFFEAVQRGDQTIVVDNTNTSVAEISPYILPAEAYGYSVEIITLEVDPATAAKRNIHQVSEEGVKRQFDRLVKEQKLFPPRWKHRVIR